MNGIDWMLFVASVVMVIAWLLSIVAWFRRGRSIPGYVHGLAIALTIAGVAVMASAVAGSFLEWRLAAACLLSPAPTTYFGWLWLFGPEFHDES